MFTPGMKKMRGVVVLLWTVALVSALLAQPASASELEPQGRATAQLQTALKSKGFYRGPIDGLYGAQTQHAVMAFRKEIGTTRSFSWSSSLWDELNT